MGSISIGTAKPRHWQFWLRCLLGVTMTAIGCAPKDDAVTLDTSSDPPAYQGNHSPEATALSIETTEDSPVDFIFLGTDADGDPLNYETQGGPAHGSLSANGAQATYTPFENYHGFDSFEYVATDGERWSEPALVEIEVVSVTDAPTVPSLTIIEGKEDEPVSFVLTGSDPDDDILSYTVLEQPLSGIVSGTAPSLTFTPSPNEHGVWTLSYQVSDGTLTSSPGIVELQIASVNDPPVAEAQDIITEEDQAIEIEGIGYDIDGDPLTFTIAFGATDGDIVGNPPTVFYDPDKDFNGDDQFAFQASDGSAVSGYGMVYITVTPVNDAPRLTDRTVVTSPGTPVDVDVTGTDPEGDPITYWVYDEPEHGTLIPSFPLVTYTPDNGFSGTDDFRFQATDGMDDSEVAKITFDVTP